MSNDRLILDDEIVYGPFHMERMDDDHIWFRIGNTCFDLYASGHINPKLTWVPQAEDWEKARQELFERVQTETEPGEPNAPRWTYMLDESDNYCLFHRGVPISPNRLSILLNEFQEIVLGYGKSLALKRQLADAEFGGSWTLLLTDIAEALRDIEPQYDMLPDWAKWRKDV